MRYNVFIDVIRAEDRGQGEPYSYNATVFNMEKINTESAVESAIEDIDTSLAEDILVNLPAEMINFRIISLPDLEPKKLREIIPFELEGSILTKRDDLVFDFLLFKDAEETAKNSCKTLVVYIDKNELKEILSPLSKLGIAPSAIISTDVKRALSAGIDSFAQRLLTLSPPDKEELFRLFKEEASTPSIRITDKDLTASGLKEGALRSIYKTSLIMLCLLLLLAGWLSFNVYTYMSEGAKIKKALRSQYSALFPEDKKVTDEVYQLKSKIKGLKDREDALIGIKALDILKRLSEGKVEGIIFSEITIEKNMLRIKGDAVSVESIDKLKKGLSWVEQLNVSDVTQAEKGRYSFTASAKIRQAP